MTATRPPASPHPAADPAAPAADPAAPAADPVTPVADAAAPASGPVRTTAAVTEPVTVFLVGMRINRLRSLGAWTSVARAMGPMLTELGRDPSLGMLGAQTYWSGRTVTTLSYWRSFDALEAYAHASDRTHRPAWTEFYRRAGRAAGAVGIFHETFTVAPGSVESLYVDVPAGFGLGGAVGTIPVTGALRTARQRRDAAFPGAGVPRSSAGGSARVGPGRPEAA
jgi:hypothetical protein